MPVAVPRKGTLIVRLLGRPVGRLDYSSHHNEMRFSYGPEYLADSMSMPWLVLTKLLVFRKRPFISHPPTDDTGLIVPSDWRSSFQ